MNKDQINELRKAQIIIGSGIHPDTKEIISWQWRMCSFVPVNVPIIFGMLMTAPTPINTIVWQWINQSYNAGMNYGNRNASSPQTSKDLMLGYSAAVFSSITVALSLRKIFAKYTTGLTGGKAIAATSAISYIAVANAGFLNTYCMRLSEMKQGVAVIDEEGNQRGVSPIAAKSAVL